MALLSSLKRDSAAMVGVLEALGIYLIYQHALPSAADTRSLPAHNNDIEVSRKHAAYESAGLLGVVFLVTHDLNAFIIGGIALVGIDSVYKHANSVNPATGRADGSSHSGQTISSSGPYSLPSQDDYLSAAS